jgi:hypothetical protein
MANIVVEPPVHQAPITPGTIEYNGTCMHYWRVPGTKPAIQRVIAPKLLSSPLPTTSTLLWSHQEITELKNLYRRFGTNTKAIILNSKILRVQGRTEREVEEVWKQIMP